MRLFLHTLQTLLFLFNKYYLASPASCSSAYGVKPCPYVPSPPGERPPCAKYGYTYCEYPEHYPRDLVMHLLEKWKFDHGTLLQNETPSDYAAYTPPPKDTYGPPPNTIYPYPAPVYGPPQHSQSPNSYIPPSPIHHPSPDVHNQSYPYPPAGSYPQPKFPYDSNVYREVQNNHFRNVHSDFTRFHQNAWNKWNGRKYYMRRKRSVAKRFLNNGHNATNLLRDVPRFLDRTKRQSFRREPEPLCESFSQFIMPRAAMNNKGDWMYVVNVPEADGRYSQLVKSETCARTGRCSNLCSVPDGYISSCEQRYVQKRLVAVEPGGGNLYTDVFWFPSCCLCTIARR